jgi:hypothetical protein
MTIETSWTAIQRSAGTTVTNDGQNVKKKHTLQKTTYYSLSSNSKREQRLVPCNPAAHNSNVGAGMVSQHINIVGAEVPVTSRESC